MNFDIRKKGPSCPNWGQGGGGGLGDSAMPERKRFFSVDLFPNYDNWDKELEEHREHRNDFDVRKKGPSCPNWGQGGGFR